MHRVAVVQPRLSALAIAVRGATCTKWRLPSTKPRSVASSSCPIKLALDERLDGQVALASACNLLHRHGLRTPAPDKSRPQVKLATWEHWKDNCTAFSANDRRGVLLL